ncbi:metallo-beta-lactamase family protein [Citreicella sp. SE45]|nr:metallo-beta-lactamase family protein [Citreicella sp. SE45]
MNDAGGYRWPATARNHMAFAEPDNAEAKNLPTDALTQMGQQTKIGPWWNFQLSGAKELSDGIVEAATSATATPDIVRNLPLGTCLDYLAVRLNHPEAAGQEIALDFMMAVAGDAFEVTVTIGVMNDTLDGQGAEADATVTLDRTVLDGINLGQTTMMDAIAGGSATVGGDAQKVEDVAGLLDTFEVWLNIVTP